MLDRRDCNVLAPVLLGQRQPFEGKIVTFCATASESYFISISAYKIRHLFTSRLNRLTGAISPIMERRWITKDIPQIRHHCLTDFRKKRCGSCIVQINPRSEERR